MISKPSRNRTIDPVQRDRFIETARELECDEDEDRFNETLKRIVKVETEKGEKPTKE